jgi:hypothetical protein
LIAIRPSIFCFIGKLATDLQSSVPMAIRKRLGSVPDVFSFISVTQDAVDLKIGARRPRITQAEGPLQSRVWQALTYAAATIGNIRVRTDALRRPPEAEDGFQVVRGGPDIYLVQCLSDAIGWEVLFAIAERIHSRSDTPAGTGRARGIFPLFHLPPADEESERDQALEGLRRLEGLVRRGVLFPSIVLDRINRNGYPLERWEDLTEILSDFLSLGSASEAGPDLWRIFPQVADLHASSDGDDERVPGLSALGLARFRFNRSLIGEHLSHLHLRDVKRTLSLSFAVEPSSPPEEECWALVNGLVERGFSATQDGAKAAEAEVIAWTQAREEGRHPSLATWARVVDRLQLIIFEKLGETAQRIENVRQESETLALESPQKDAWLARISVLVPDRFYNYPWVLAGGLAGALFGILLQRTALAGFFMGGVLGAVGGYAVARFARRKDSSRETFTLGEFTESTFAEGFPVPRTLEPLSRSQRMAGMRSGLSIQLWGELRSQVDPLAKERIDSMKARLAQELAAGRKEEAELVFLDRMVNALRERIEIWRLRLGEVEVWEPGRGFAGDIFPSDGPRKIYDALKGREDAEKQAAAILPRITPALEASVIIEMADEGSTTWGREHSGDLQFEKVLQILDDRPEDLLERLSEASAPLWPRPGDRDELLRCFGDDFGKFARDSDVRHSLKDETVFIRVLGGIKSTELARA